MQVKLGNSLVSVGNLEEACSWFKSVEKNHPDNPGGYLGNARILGILNQWESARKSYQKTLKRFPNRPAAVTGLAGALSKTGKTIQAKNVLTGFLNDYPDSPTVSQMLLKLQKIRKADVINKLIEKFKFTTYLEYNKFLGEMAFNEVICRKKVLAYIPEKHECDVESAQLMDHVRSLEITSKSKIFDPDALINKYGKQQFDVIFFDPVHVRPHVDYALKVLPKLLVDDGFLVVHDSNPPTLESTSVQRCKGAWCGETYLAFANFHRHNPWQSITIDEDYGVGLIFNHGLNLEYSDRIELDFKTFDGNREFHIGLISYDQFCSKLQAAGKQLDFMESVSSKLRKP